MGNRMLFAKGEWDENLSCSLPCGMSPTWMTDGGPCRAPLSLGEYLTRDLITRGPEMMSSFINRQYDNSLYVSTKTLSDGKENYFYPIHIYDPSFFIHNREIGFSLVEDYVIRDVRKGRCKIILIQDVEGLSGAKNTHHESELMRIDEWCCNAGIDPKNVYYICGNLLCDVVARHQNIKCNVIPVSIFESWVSVFKFPPEICEYEPYDERDLFLCYSRRPRFNRVLFVAKMMREGLMDRGLWSFSTMNNEAPVEATDEIDPNLTQYVRDLYSMSPVIIDRENESDDITTHISMRDYEQTFITVAGETLHEEDVLFLTEKTFKPIMAGVPFVVNGNMGALAYLKSLGYITFDRWIDESYDDEPDFVKRIDIIIGELKRFSKMSHEELKTIREEMKPVCKHNKDLITKRTNDLFYSDNSFYHHKPTSDVLYRIWKRWNNIKKRLI